MGYWDYRIVKKDHKYTLYEVEYGDDGTIESWNEASLVLEFENLEDFYKEVENLVSAFKKPPLIEIEDTSRRLVVER